MEITIKIPAIDNLADAIRTLAKEQAAGRGGFGSIALNLDGQPVGSGDGPAAHLAPSTPVTYDETVYNPPAAPVAPTAPPAAPVAPPAAPVAPAAPPTAPVAPAAPAAPAAPVAPTAPATYTRQQLAIAATGLVDAERKNDLVALLSQFGIKSLTELPEQNFGVFATALRQMGAAI